MADTPSAFEITTPLGLVVYCTETRWQEILIKHPALAERLDDVKTVLIEPLEIRRSAYDETVALFYRSDGKRFLCVVVNRVSGILVTAYPTDTIKTGESLWSK